jgi:hypothetical protein
VVDRRKVGWEPLRGLDAFTALVTSTWEVSLDARYQVDEVLAIAESTLAARPNWVGHSSLDIGGGEFAIELAEVT